MFLAGYQSIRSIFDGYRAAYETAHAAPAPVDRLAYAALVYVGETSAKARDGAEKLLWYMHSNKVTPHHSNPPGYHPPELAAQFLVGSDTAMSNSKLPTSISLDDQIARGNVFAGTPDEVYAQIKTFWEYSGGFGNLIIMGQAGFLSFDDAVSSMRLYSQEVLPRLKALNANHSVGRMQELRAAMPDRQMATLGDFGREFVR